MRLFLLRHGEAGYDALSDELRSITPAGQLRLKSMLQQNAGLFGAVETVFHSPYLRTTQTAELVAEVCAAPLQISDLLVPEASPQQIIDFLLEQNRDNDIMLVTHQPLIGYLVSLLCEGDLSHPEPMLPGAMAVIDLELPAAGLGALAQLL